jgi:predicted DNA-binding protein (UPF0251 family)
VRRAIAELPVEFREIVILREMEGFSYKEIADLAEVPIGTVMSRLARARKLLQKSLTAVNSIRRPTMNCQQAKPLIDPYADGELEAAAILELEQHLQSCSACGIAWRNLQSLKKTLKQDALYFTAPEELRQRIKSELPSPARAVPPWRWPGIGTG